jgi:hypothetical protein
MVTTPLEELRARIRVLRAGGSGYLEISRPGRLFPALFVAFGGEHAVVHFDDETSLFQLYGGESVPAEETAEVFILEGMSPFPGECVMTLDRALEVMEEFVRTGAVGEHPRWSTS